jgi:hypothetical protein
LKLGNLENYIELKKQTAATRNVIRKTKKEAFQKLCSSFSRLTPITEIWSKVKSFNKGSSKPICVSSGELDIEEYADYLCPSYVASPGELEIHINPENTDSVHHQPFNIEELQLALSQTKDTTTGNDDISYSMLKNLPSETEQKLLEVINQAWKTGEFPPTWKEIIIKPIPKPDKPRDQVKGYRPIALISCVAKTFERLVKNRLEVIIEKSQKIPHCFTGFRKGFSTMDNLSQLITDIQLSFSSNLHLVTAIYDLQGAYDNVHIPTPITKLINLGIPHSICKILQKYLINRTIYVKGKTDTSQARITSRGLPQGSVLSPTLFLMYTLDIKDYIPRNIEISAYADDLVVYIKATSIPIKIHNLEQTNLEIKKLLLHSQLDINPDKSEFMIFSKSHQKNIYNTLRFGNDRIRRVQQHKFLGITIDDNLAWKPHITNTINTCMKAITIIKAT